MNLLLTVYKIWHYGEGWSGGQQSVTLTFCYFKSYINKPKSKTSEKVIFDTKCHIRDRESVMKWHLLFDWFYSLASVLITGIICFVELFPAWRRWSTSTIVSTIARDRKFSQNWNEKRFLERLGRRKNFN